MATFTEETTLKYITTTDGDLEEHTFSSGDEITVLEEWDDYYLIKDDDDHIYNVPHDKIAK